MYEEWERRGRGGGGGRGGKIEEEGEVGKGERERRGEEGVGEEEKESKILTLYRHQGNHYNYTTCLNMASHTPLQYLLNGTLINTKMTSLGPSLNIATLHAGNSLMVLFLFLLITN